MLVTIFTGGREERETVLSVQYIQLANPSQMQKACQTSSHTPTDIDIYKHI